MTSTILHNPKCSTSRNALALMQASDDTVEVVEYLKTPPSRGYLVELLAKMQMSPRELMRSKEAVFTELGLDNPDVTEDQLIDAMVEHPILINRPIVITDKGAVLCRPLENIFDVLTTPVKEFTKENGDVIVNPNA
ncbi:arsenate reductase (glutaredoxin) [Psychrobacter phenylpyruvicus]|uniref:Arsenate reductase n=1 Tax=Psychrobacter phenylpyruvicus TaxID=29432 RepID=A0A379LL79_9GAMM|nr:arsenate reductase (glutaredoxin) [Psychrobacter phenylpyruvicus]SUD91336.1 Arsenate reductase [Psychrobacter phenylpyruvicus]